MTHERLMRTVNEEIREFARRTDPSGRAEWEFLCECDHLGCTDHVKVRLGVYTRLREEKATYVVAPGHEDPAHDDVVEHHPEYLIIRARKARQAAKAKQESAAALRAQAEQQLRRALRNQQQAKP